MQQDTQGGVAVEKRAGQTIDLAKRAGIALIRQIVAQINEGLDCPPIPSSWDLNGAVSATMRERSVHVTRVLPANVARWKH